MQVYIKNRKRRNDEFQFFMHDFVDVCKKDGINARPDVMPFYKYHIRSLLRRILLLAYGFINSRWPKLLKNRKALIITADGGTIADNFFPYYFHYELVPFLWDVWPWKWLQMQNDFLRFGVRTVFVTVHSVANMINEEMQGIKALWVPEGIEISHYHKGENLTNRPYDVLEMGRQMKKYHNVLEHMHKKGILKEWTTSIINSDGTLCSTKLAFKDNETLYKELSKYKIMVCFPQCDTNPFRGGNVETLTQRYWEAMLSGCIMIGRAPQELIDLIGYNPVIDVDWEEPEEQLLNILNRVSAYQDLIEQNYVSAKQHASWESRMNMIKNFLMERGYEL